VGTRRRKVVPFLETEKMGLTVAQPASRSRGSWQSPLSGRSSSEPSGSTSFRTISLPRNSISAKTRSSYSMKSATFRANIRAGCCLDVTRPDE